MRLLVIVDRGLRRFRVRQEFYKQRVTFGAKVPVVLVEQMATRNRYL